MRLYSRTGATVLDDPEYGQFTPDETGAFDFPDDVSDRLHAFHLRGRPMWETEIERQQRLMQEEVERRKDPATLLAVMEQLASQAQALAAINAPQIAKALAPAAPAAETTAPVVVPVTPPAPAAEPAKSPRKRASSKPSTS